jgi:hypothetical protein
VTADRVRASGAAERRVNKTSGFVYLPHFSRPYKHARHYLG